ncbi:MAG: S8 family serine peptidase, partial [Promethearchaeota archaeon]
DYFSGGSPGAATGSITVGSVDLYGNVSTFSSRGPNLARMFDPDVLAPGEGIPGPLAYGSYLERLIDYIFYGTSPSAQNQNRYIFLSGTSMSTPIVAGAAALIMQKFSSVDLSPYIIKSCLMETALDTGIGICSQGAGIINVSRAISYLDSYLNSSLQLSDWIKIYPRKIPYQPFDLINFPGDSQDIELDVIYGGNHELYFNMQGNITGISLFTNTNPLVLSGGPNSMNFTIKICTAFNATPGIYNFTVNVTDESNRSVGVIQVSFTLKIPILKVYIDGFHSLKDLIPNYTLPQSSNIDYYSLVQELVMKNIQVVINMDYWTFNYNSSSRRDFFTFPFLNNFDAIFIPPLKISLFESEISALKKYLEIGGHLIILGSRKELFSIEATNHVLDELGLDVRFLQNNYEDLIDMGFSASFLPFQLNRMNRSSFLFRDVQDLYWTYGCTINNTADDFINIVENENSDILLAFRPSMDGNGSILLAGSDSFLTQGGFEDDRDGMMGNAIFLKNLFNYYLLCQDIHVNGYISDQQLINASQIKFAFQAVNISNQNPLSNSEICNVSCNLVFENNTVQSVDLTNFTDGYWIGNENINISSLPNSTQPYEIRVGFNVGDDRYQYNCFFYKYDGGLDSFNFSLSNTSAYRDQDLNLTFNDGLPNLKVKVDGIPDNFLSRGIPYTGYNTVNDSSQITFDFNETIPSGNYYLTFVRWDSVSYPFPTMQRYHFSINNYDPVIDRSRSMVQQTSFESLNLGEDMMQVVNVLSNNYILLDVFGLDNESAIEDLSVLAIYYPTCIVGSTLQLIEYGPVLIMQELVYSNETGGFSCNFLIPQTVHLSIYGHSIDRSTETSQYYSGGILIILRDGDGGFDYFFIILNISASNTFDPALYPFFIIGGVIGLSILIFIRARPLKIGPKFKSTRISKGIYKRRAVEQEYKRPVMRYCPYCGHEIKKRKKKRCPACNRTINFF